ncbi:hypothetical protein FRC02_007839 [Tulasnella sp. 418]|nr:hypothetical protein FRC02_007839 [Tulasnella sp. 418]
MRNVKKIKTNHVKSSSKKSSLPPSCLIDRLPFDILHHIFHLAKDATVKRKPVIMSTAYSHVCKYWRDSILRMPVMWDRIDFTRHGRLDKWAKAKEYLRRSRNSPIDIGIFSGETDDKFLDEIMVSKIFRIVMPHIRRWRSVHAFIDVQGWRVIENRIREASAPALESLSVLVYDTVNRPIVWSCQVFEGGLPKLRCWKLPLIPPSMVIPHLCELRELHIDESAWGITMMESTIQGLILVLGQCKKLEHLTLKIAAPLGYEPSILAEDTRVVFPHLLSLDLGKDQASMWGLSYLRPLFRHIEAPNLRVINTGGFYNSILPIIKSKNPFPALTSLNLRQHLWREQEATLNLYSPTIIEGAFSKLSNLVELTLTHQLVRSNLFDVLKTHCPRLVSLEFNTCGFFCWECVNMVSARKRSKTLSSIKRLIIFGNGPIIVSPQYRHWLQVNVETFAFAV